ncbi:thiamine ABC transporter substrate binding subunit [Oricola cellulosilytica]|uniref:Thiamine-binding periplasmic protein n=1 Tax=Oricola cellulosilytica TaxID=1429082 RepID=A0A4R0PEV7_9HYPH|nr:thiamine ABC transporter substrate binding subunit [Oricola cellulosilytica]TCD13913.1 thiamine ABC transporter substrate binding subunit [Oricola cellulosilytica]
MHKKLFALSASVLLSLSFLPAQAQETLTVYTYESFTSEWGPGPQVEETFEKDCGCDLVFVPVADGVVLLNRLRLEGGNTDADIVLGLDTNLTAEAKETGFFAPHGITTEAVAVPGGWTDETFLPYDYGYFAFIYDTEVVDTPPSSMEALLAGDVGLKIAIQDPRTSTPGLGLLLWIRKIYGDDAPEAYAKLADRVLTVTPGWSEAYGLFTSGEAPMVLSYTTSPAYHMIAEQTDRYQAAAFEEGHYMQIEVAAKTTRGAQNPLADRFLQFMLSPSFQDIIPQTNWMFPAAPTSAPLDPVFDSLVEPARALLFSPDEVADNRKTWIDEWLSAMTR